MACSPTCFNNANYYGAGVQEDYGILARTKSDGRPVPHSTGMWLSSTRESA
jgi:hypothetical protein